MRKTPKKFAGRWLITDMTSWDQQARNLCGPAFIAFHSSAQGTMRFIAVDGDLDCRFEGNRVDFSWLGFDDRDSSGGRGWATLDDDGKLRGMIYIHNGDDTDFKAERLDG